MRENIWKIFFLFLLHSNANLLVIIYELHFRKLNFDILLAIFRQKHVVTGIHISILHLGYAKAFIILLGQLPKAK